MKPNPNQHKFCICTRQVMLEVVTNHGRQDAQHFRDMSLYTHIHEIHMEDTISKVMSSIKKFYFIMNSSHGGCSIFTELLHVKWCFVPSDEI